MSSSTSTAMICFNRHCKTSISQQWRKGWRLRNFHFANLCHRCGSIYEEGRFCEVFHKNVSGWRCCETCGKQVHCGCVVSVDAYAMLDPGGIECAVCARKSAILAPNPMWPRQHLTGWLTECSIKNCNQISRPDFIGGFQQIMDMSTGIARPFWNSELAAMSSERDKCKNLSFSHGNANGSKRLEDGKSVFSCEEVHSCLVNPRHQSLVKERQSALHLGLGFGQLTNHEENHEPMISCGLVPKLHRSQDVQKHCSMSHSGSGSLNQPFRPQDIAKKRGMSSRNGNDSSSQTQMHNYRLVDVHGQKELLSRYRPKIICNELQQISGSANSVITPLFEKMLSVSDTGRVGRLVLPKKCAENYFPPISKPEGLPLKVQDVKGKEWMFQFRFWPNNNSRMYVLEGITTCIQSLQLQAGDIVTFSRIQPEGKLLMGFRKASTGSQYEQHRTQGVKNDSEVPTVRDVGSEKRKLDEVKEAVEASSLVPCKRKNGMLSSKKKRSRVDNANFLELKVSLEEVQRLFRSPHDHAVHVETIDGFKFEEFEDAPVIGRPTCFAQDSLGENVLWAQCDDCLKWRKLPPDYNLSAKWTCSKNFLDPDRSSCDAAQELSPEELKVAFKKLLDAQWELHTSEVLEAFASFSIGEDDTGTHSTQPTKKKLIYERGYSPVCNQPLDDVTCNKYKKGCVCEYCKFIVKRVSKAFRSKWKSAKTQECSARNNVQAPGTSPPKIKPLAISPQKLPSSFEKVIYTPIKGEIDLNIKPERDEEDSTCCDAGTKTMITCHVNEDELLPGKLICDKYKLDVNYRHGLNHAIVNDRPVVHQSTSTSVSR